MKNKVNAKFWGQAGRIMGDVQVANCPFLYKERSGRRHCCCCC